jgi:imidazolonepropionase
MSSSVLIYNISDLVTLAPLGRARRANRVEKTDLGRYENAWLACENGKVVGFGSGKVDARFEGFPKKDARSSLVMPGLVDSHTHPIFGGNRAKEFCARLDGKTYQDIAASGGGIKFTVAETRSATDENLLAFTKYNLRRFLSLGITTLEAKSGYGLSPTQELRLLRIIKAAANASPQTVVSTCLALHAVPKEYASKEAYIREIISELLPEIQKQKLATYVDAFVEKGYFSVEDTAPYIEKARSLGLKVRIHADEFADGGGASAAATWGAASADHLEHASAGGIAAMAKAHTVAILLPGTSLYTGIPYANARRFIDQGCAVALATDFNPGSCVVDNLAFIATIGALHCKLKPHEAIAAVTYAAAFSLGLGESKGSLAEGFDADFFISPLKDMESWLSDLGRHPPTEVWIAGKGVL